MSSESPWFAVYTKSRHEKVVHASLMSQGVEAYLPSHKVLSQWQDRRKWVEKPLFPGYLFARLLQEQLASPCYTGRRSRGERRRRACLRAGGTGALSAGSGGEAGIAGALAVPDKGPEGAREERPSLRFGRTSGGAQGHAASGCVDRPTPAFCSRRDGRRLRGTTLRQAGRICRAYAVCRFRG